MVSVWPVVQSVLRQEAGPARPPVQITTGQPKPKHRHPDEPMLRLRAQGECTQRTVAMLPSCGQTLYSANAQKAPTPATLTARRATARMRGSPWVSPHWFKTMSRTVLQRRHVRRSVVARLNSTESRDHLYSLYRGYCPNKSPQTHHSEGIVRRCRHLHSCSSGGKKSCH